MRLQIQFAVASFSGAYLFEQSCGEHYNFAYPKKVDQM